MGEEIFRATAGSYVLKPCGVSHTFWNPAGPLYAGVLDRDRTQRVLRVLGRWILAGTGLDQHRLVPDARAGGLRPRRRRGARAAHHRWSVPGGRLLRVFR